MDDVAGPPAVNPAARPAGPALEVRHETVYHYESPVSLAHHQAHLQPLADADQMLVSHWLEIDPPAAFRRDSRDAMGNAQTHFSLALPHRQLRVCATSRVRLQDRFEALRPASGPPWEPLAAGLRYVARSVEVAAASAGPAPMRFEPAVEFVSPSPYVPRLPALRAYALPSFPPGCPVAEAALHLMQRLHADFAYESRSTEVDTPLQEVLAQRRGVCQDFAHLLIGCLRVLGLPARYVSGYLLTRAPGGGAPLVGADASHAWVQVWCPGTDGVADWLDLDPTNNVVPAAGHVRVAVGRDYGDVTPLKGVIRGGGQHELAVGVSTRMLEPVLEDTPAADLDRSPGAVAR
ncbi:MAG: transglutaminase family protein [Burkholderiales bacterium]|nr:transglutaminase family protein [Burkholderiales bacterium]